MRGLTAFVAVAALVGIANADAKFWGCFKDMPKMKLINENLEFNSRGACRVECTEKDVKRGGKGYSTMMMTEGNKCYCGNSLPNKKIAVEETDCRQECEGYPDESCGDRLGKFFSVYTTGLEENPIIDPLPSKTTTSSSSSTSSTSEQPEETTSSAAQTTIAVSVDPTPSDSEEDKGSGVNKAAVAAGCVVAVLAIIGISVGVFLFMRKRRRQKVEEDFRRSAAVREFSQKPASDHRLDPGMVQRRDSVGSIADNQDYSRRILKVTNPDGN